jgi:signal transduction histidine kinase
MWDIIWGSMGLLAGLMLFLLPIAFPNIRVMMIVVSIVAAVLLASGIWLMAAPSPLAMLVDGVTLILLSLVNLGWWIHQVMQSRAAKAAATASSATSDSPGYVWLLLFAFSLLGGISRFRRYSRFKAAAQTPPSRATLQWLHEMRRHLKRARVQTVPMFIRFESSAIPPLAARVQLLPQLAVCLINGDRFSFVPEPELTIEPLAPIPPGKKGKAQIRMQGRQFNGMIHGDSFARYVAWKDAQEAEVELQDDHESQGGE